MTDIDPAASSVQGGQVDTNRPSNEEGATNVSNPTSTTQEPDIHYPSGIILVLIVSGLLLSMFLVALDMSIIATAVPRITSDFSSMEDIGWYGSAFFLTQPGNCFLLCLNFLMSDQSYKYMYPLTHTPPYAHPI
ncbi:hypothetical protein FJTKL_06559 [Diaporthe vaccinii]|uniref:Major facilitator superfamily (MFS) profile domain-containing protein n=1 Tax=Diaporthe vaccinii TaxID=105482 RepID=A0ABR4DQV2_9PEZI